MANQKRFTINKTRLVVTENDVKFYKRDYGTDMYGPYSNEHAVTPQHAGQLRKKYANEIKDARNNLNG